MKKTIYCMLVLFLAFTLLMLSSCDDTGDLYDTSNKNTIDDLCDASNNNTIDENSNRFVLMEGEISEWMVYPDFEAVEEVVVTSSDENVVEIITAVRPIGHDRISVIKQAVGIGEATVTAKTVDGEIIATAQVRVEKQKHVYIGEGELCKAIELDKTEAELYKDDTTVTYTITTSKDVDKIELIQWSQYLHEPGSFEAFLDFKQNNNDLMTEVHRLDIDESKLVDKMTQDELNGKYYSAARTTSGDQAVWTIKWDLGNTAVKFVQINSIDGDTDTVQENYVKLNVHYPLLDASLGLEGVITRWVELNLDEPFFYEIDVRTLTDEQMEIYLSAQGVSIYADEEFVLLGMLDKRSALTREDYKIDEVDNKTLYDKIFDASPIYRSNYISQLNGFGMVNSLDTTEDVALLIERMIQTPMRVLPNGNYGTRTFMYYYTITEEIRAIIAYQNGFEIDAEKFPYAHSILERSSEVLEQIITEGMTDFEKEKAIYTWMMNLHYANENNYKPTPEGVEEQYIYTKTPYGLLNGYYGDCMGWSGTFFTLCNMAGVDCATIDADSIDADEVGGPVEWLAADHRLNLVRIDGEYYFVDSYWSWQKGGIGEGEYSTLNMTSEVASTNYKWSNEEGFGPMECNYETYLVDAYTGELLNE